MRPGSSLALAAALLLAACSAVPLPRRSPYHASDADLGVTRIVFSPWTSSREAIDGMRRFADEFGFSGS